MLAHTPAQAIACSHPCTTHCLLPTLHKPVPAPITAEAIVMRLGFAKESCSPSPHCGQPKQPNTTARLKSPPGVRVGTHTPAPLAMN